MQALPPVVTVSAAATVTVPRMRKWGDYWARVCAPKVRDKKKEIGRAMPEREIARDVELATGKPSERSLVSMWLLGKREPFLSQFLALCEKLEMDPFDVLRDTKINKPRVVAERQPIREMRNKSKKRQNSHNS